MLRLSEGVDSDLEDGWHHSGRDVEGRVIHGKCFICALQHQFGEQLFNESCCVQCSASVPMSGTVPSRNGDILR